MDPTGSQLDILGCYAKQAPAAKEDGVCGQHGADCAGLLQAAQLGGSNQESAQARVQGQSGQPPSKLSDGARKLRAAKNGRAASMHSP